MARWPPGPYVTAVLCWFDHHEGAGSWLGALATFLAVVVALALPFVMRWLDHVSQIQRVAFSSFMATHHARTALKLIMDLQRELYARGQTELNATNRQWEFELQVAHDTMAQAVKPELRDPALLPLLMATQRWIEMAIGVLPLSQADGLFQMQYSTAAREKTFDDLLALQLEFLEVSTHLWPPRRKRSNAPPMG